MNDPTLHLAGMLSYRCEGYLRQIQSLIFANLRSSLAPAAITLVLSVLISVPLSKPANSQVTSPDLLAAKALLAPRVVLSTNDMTISRRSFSVGDVAQLVERQVDTLRVVASNPAIPNLALHSIPTACIVKSIRQ